MKKAIQKPENWQDFETLCKKLWGEIWNIPMKIKKNGRNGQTQAGVDIYGIPKGETNYWGIQCKGKDDYTNAKLSKSEIDREIGKAKNFSPKLSVFIFATTMNKDVEIEEYVREKDMESREKGEFEILLFCWEDIADLIDENQDTYNFWVANKLHRTKFELEVSLNDMQSIFTIRPKCVRTIKRYRIKDIAEEYLRKAFAHNFNSTSLLNEFHSPEFIKFINGNINEAICSFQITLANIGTAVIEDWRVRFTINGEHKKIMDQLGSGPLGLVDISFSKNKCTFIENNIITYSPHDNEPLIQKDKRNFEIHIIPHCKEYSIPIEWELLARDFNSNGKLTLNVIPDYDDNFIFEYVESEEELKDDEVIKVEEKKNYQDEN